MTCRLWVDQGHIACNAWTDEVSATCSAWADKGSYQCGTWADEGSNQCSSWADHGSNQCSKWADEGSNQCSSWADEGHNECCDWWPCSWLCDAFYWVANWICQAWYWVAKWVCKAWYWAANWICQAWYWVAKWVCKAWYWLANIVCQAFVIIIKAVCLIWSWIAKLVCVLWDNGKCLFQSVFGSRLRARSPIKHVFVLMLENRAFDHMLGFSKLTGFDPALGSERLVDGVLEPAKAGPGFVVKANIANPFEHADPGTGADVTDMIDPSVEADFLLSKPADIDPPHEFKNALEVLCGKGAAYVPGQPYPAVTNKGFIANYGDGDSDGNTPADPSKIMKCYSEARVPVITALAREFALCDRWFSSLPGPTWPNRFFMHAASSGGLDDSPSGLSSFGNIAFDGYTFNNGTIFDRLDDACIEWRVFAGDSFPVTLALSGMTLNDLTGKIHDFEDFADAVNDPDFSTAYTFIEPDYGHDLPPTAQDFRCGNSQHPLDDVTRGERLIKVVYEAIRNSPHWNESLLLVTYDEHGGFFDHVAPPGAPQPQAVPPGDGVSDEDNVFNNFAFDQFGVRVPAIVISPFIERNRLDGLVYDHTSLLATVERLFGLKPLTRRDAAANSLLHLLTRKTPRGDTPARLVEPANSGFVCEDDDEDEGDFTRTGSGVSSSQDALTRGDRVETPYDWRREKPKVDSTLRGFQEIALLKALKAARGRDRAQIRKEFLAADTVGGAKHFIHKVAAMTGNDRRLATRRSALTRFLAAPARRTWQHEPIHNYRMIANEVEAQSVE